MQKDELIQLHTFLLQLKTHLEDIVDNNCGIMTGKDMESPCETILPVYSKALAAPDAFIEDLNFIQKKLKVK